MTPEVHVALGRGGGWLDFECPLLRHHLLPFEEDTAAFQPFPVCARKGQSSTTSLLLEGGDKVPFCCGVDTLWLSACLAITPHLAVWVALAGEFACMIHQQKKSRVADDALQYASLFQAAPQRSWVRT